MMNFLPSHQETFVTPLVRGEVTHRLMSVTTEKVIPGDKSKFHGWVSGGKFKISLKIIRANNYLPIISGHIEETSSGSILFLNYYLFPTTRLFLIFWLCFLLLATIIASIRFSNYIYTLGGFALMGLIYWIVWANFKIQLQLSRETLLNILS